VIGGTKYKEPKNGGPHRNRREGKRDTTEKYCGKKGLGKNQKRRKIKNCDFPVCGKETDG